MTDQDVLRGAGIYSRSVLSIYDLLVVRISNSFAWSCPSTVMLDRYNRHLAARHLDVGPGTGWYLAHAELPSDAEVTLMDLNTNSLESAVSRMPQRVATTSVLGDVLEPLPQTIGTFSSIGINYLLHCVPGAWDAKGKIFPQLAAHLDDDGVLFGSTILGRGVRHNLGGKALMTLYAKLGIFNNRDDDAHGLRVALEQCFHTVEVETVGTVALFTARDPMRA